MNYKAEFNRLLDAVNQYLNNNNAVAPYTVLQNAANYYNDMPAEEDTTDFICPINKHLRPCAYKELKK